MPKEKQTPDAVVPAAAEESKPVAEEAKPVAEEAKPAAEEAKPAAAEEAKPAEEEAKPAANKKSGKVWKKILKCIGIFFAVVFVLLLLALIFRDLLIGPVTGLVGSSLTGTKVKLEKVDTSLFRGYVRLGGFSVDNPQGYNAERKAIKLGEVYVKISIGSLFTKKIEVEEVNVDGLEVYMESTLNGINLLDILDNIKKKTESKKKKKKKTESDVQVVIRHLKVEKSFFDSNLMPKISLDLEKKDIGDDGGSSWKDLWGELTGKFKLTGDGWFKKLFSK